MHRLVGATTAFAVVLFALLASTAVAGHGGKRPPGHGGAAKGRFARVLFVDHAKVGMRSGSSTTTRRKTPA